MHVTAGRDAKTYHLAGLFRWDHLSDEAAREVSRDCHDIAQRMVNCLQDGEELWAGLRKLVEAKDCFVRQCIDDNMRTV